MLWLSKLDGPLLLLVNFTVVDTIHSKSNKLSTGVKIKAIAELQLSDSLGKSNIPHTLTI